MISLFTFNDSCELLKSAIADLPKQGWGANRRLAMHLGVNSSLVSLVLTGRQSFSIEQALGVTQFFGWTNLESKYFLSLVQRERAGTTDLKKHFESEITRLRDESLKLSQRLDQFTGLTDEQRTRFYSSSIYSKIRLFCSLKKDGMSVQDIQARFDIQPSELIQMLEFLTESGLLKIKDGRYQMGHQHTHLEKESPHLVRHHTNWRIESIRKAERLTDQELMFTGPMSLSESDFMKIREDILLLIQKTVSTMKQSPEETLVCLNIDWIKI